MSYGISADLITNLTAKGRKEGKVIDYVWYDISHSDPSAAYPVDVSLNQRILIADASGRRTLVPKVVGQDTNYILYNAFDLVDALFTDSGNPADPFYTSYVQHYQNSTATSEMYDMLLTYDNVTNDTRMTVDYAERHNNSIEFHLDQMEDGTDNLVESRKVLMDTHLDFLPSANVTDVSSNITINVHQFGVNIENAHYNLGQSNPVLEFWSNSLSANSVVKFVPDPVANDVEFNDYPAPTIALSQAIAPHKIVGAGRTKVIMPVTLPTVTSGFKAGAWNWKVHVEDSVTGYKSLTSNFRLQVLPRFSEPDVTFSEALNFQYDVSKNNLMPGSSAIDVTMHYKSSDVTNNDIIEWGQTLAVGAQFGKRFELGWGLVSIPGFTLTDRGQNMTDNLDFDASGNWTIAYDATVAKYTMDNGIYALFLSYNDDITTRYIIKPINITGRTHVSKVVYTNNLDGTYTLSGGNKGPDEFYVYRANAGSWLPLPAYNNVLAKNRNVFTVSTNTDYEFAVSDKSSGTISAYSTTISDLLAVDIAKPSIDISSGEMFNDIDNANVVEMDANGNIINSSSNFEGAVQTVTDNKEDVYINVATPSWLEKRSDTMVKICLHETVVPGNQPNIVGMDVSNNYFHKSGLKIANQYKWQSTIDASLNNVIDGVNYYDIDSHPILVDFQLREERLSSSEATLVSELWYAGQMRYSATSKYYLKATIVANPGNRYNNLIIPNMSKVNLTKGTNGSMTKLPLADVSNNDFLNHDISDNTWRNLALGPNAMMYANVPRSDFMGSAGHSFDISGLHFTASGNNGAHPIKLWLPFAQYGNSLTSGTPLNLEGFGDVQANFSNYGDIFIDLGFFAGTLDIQYSTYFKSEVSAEVNTLRLVVLPRPGIDLTVRDPAENVHRVGAPTWVTETAKNIQLDNNNNEIAFVSGDIAIYDAVGTPENIEGLVDLYTRLKFVSRTYTDIENPSSGLITRFDVSDNFEPVDYGEITTATVKFNGVDLDYSEDGTGDVSNNVHVLEFNTDVTFKRHQYFVAGTQVSDNEDFTIYVINDADEILAAATMIVNDIHMSGTLSINNIDFLRYFIADSSEGGTINLNTDPRFTNTTFLIIENSDYNTLTVDYGNTESVTLTTAVRHMFVKTAGNLWSDWSIAEG